MASSLSSHAGSRHALGMVRGGVVLGLVLCLTIIAAGCGSKAKGPATAGAEKAGAPEKATTPSGGGAKGAKATESASKSSAKSGEKSKSTEKSKAAEKSKTAAKTKSTEKTKSAEKVPEKPAEKPAAKPAPRASGGESIRLVDRGCISFEPHWTTIRVGQSLTWHSDLKTTVTIHVPPGAFDQTEFVVPAHGTVHSGPAQNPGDHNMWSTPGACQAAPLGVQGAGPGVTVEER